MPGACLLNSKKKAPEFIHGSASIKEQMNKQNDMQKLIDGLQILSKTANRPSSMAAYDGVIKVGYRSPHPTEEDKQKLEDLGWYQPLDEDLWAFYVG